MSMFVYLVTIGPATSASRNRSIGNKSQLTTRYMPRRRVFFIRHSLPLSLSVQSVKSVKTMSIYKHAMEVQISSE